MGYRVYVGTTYHSYHKTKTLAQAAVAKITQVDHGLGSTPRPKTSFKAKGLGSAPRPKASSKGSRSKAKGLGSIPRPKAKTKHVLKGSHLKNKTKAGLGSTPRPHAILFKGIVPRFSVRKGAYIYRAIVRQPGTDRKLYLGTSDSQRDLATKLANVTQSGLCFRKKSKRRPMMEAIRRFKLLTAIFKGWLPRDLDGAVKRRAQAAMMMVQAPGMYVAFLMGREHSWRDAVLKTWDATDQAQKLLIAGLDSNDESIRWHASKAMHDILRGAFSEWSRETLIDPEQRREWKAHVDRNVGYHLSLTAWGCREGLLKKSSCAKSLGVQNREGDWYELCVYNKHEHHARILQMHRLGRMLLQMQVPRKNQEWLESIERFGQRCSQARINSGRREDNYQFWWLARTYLIVEMRHQGIEQLRVVTDWDKDQVIAAMVPDMSEWLQSWMSSKDMPSLKTLLSKLAYREPLEMLSCFCCILGDNDIDGYSTDALESARDVISNQRRLMKEASTFKDEAHPAITIQKAMAIAQG